jgi:predicted nucleic acid-binding protein
LPRYFYLDASALAKRYVPESGTGVINYLFSRVPAHRISVLHLGVAEVISIFVRKHNSNLDCGLNVRTKRALNF